MESSEWQRWALTWITRLVWVSVGIFVILAAVSLLLYRWEVPDWELYMQLGFIGGAAAMVVMGSLQLMLAALRNHQSVYGRLMRVAGFFLGNSGALLTLGLFFDTLKYPNAGLFLQYGTVGAAVSLAAMGLLMLMKTGVLGTSGEG